MDGWIGRAGVERGRETEGRPFSWLRGEGKFDEFIAGCSRVGTLYTIIHTR